MSPKKAKKTRKARKAPKVYDPRTFHLSKAAADKGPKANQLQHKAHQLQEKPQPEVEVEQEEGEELCLFIPLPDDEDLSDAMYFGTDEEDLSDAVSSSTSTTSFPTEDSKVFKAMRLWFQSQGSPYSQPFITLEEKLKLDGEWMQKAKELDIPGKLH